MYSMRIFFYLAALGVIYDGDNGDIQAILVHFIMELLCVISFLLYNLMLNSLKCVGGTLAALSVTLMGTQREF